MAESIWSTLYDEAKSGVVAGIAEGTYEVEVKDVRARAESRLLFLDLQVLAGPLAGKIAQVNLYLPEAGNRGAGYHFRNKILGFGDLSETFKQMDSATDVGSALDILADALTGRKVIADIELRLLRRVKRTASAKPPFYGRHEVRHNTQELRSHWLHIIAIAQETDRARERIDRGTDHHSVVPKDRTARLGVSMTDPTIPRMFDAVYGGQEPAEEVA